MLELAAGVKHKACLQITFHKEGNAWCVSKECQAQEPQGDLRKIKHVQI